MAYTLTLVRRTIADGAPSIIQRLQQCDGPTCDPTTEDALRSVATIKTKFATFMATIDAILEVAPTSISKKCRETVVNQSALRGMVETNIKYMEDNAARMSDPDVVDKATEAYTTVISMMWAIRNDCGADRI